MFTLFSKVCYYGVGVVGESVVEDVVDDVASPQEASHSCCVEYGPETAHPVVASGLSDK